MVYLHRRALAQTDRRLCPLFPGWPHGCQMPAGILPLARRPSLSHMGGEGCPCKPLGSQGSGCGITCDLGWDGPRRARGDLLPPDAEVDRAAAPTPMIDDVSRPQRDSLVTLHRPGTGTQRRNTDVCAWWTNITELAGPSATGSPGERTREEGSEDETAGLATDAKWDGGQHGPQGKCEVLGRKGKMMGSI